MPIGQLAQVLRGVSTEKHEHLLVGPETFDDAGVVELAGVEGLSADTNLALVQTVDYFPPVVDDPWFYGAIAAANSLSDVYAMGGRPYTALNMAGIPKDFPADWTAEIFRGGFETVRKSGAMVVGGHTVQSAEAIFGFAVTGFVDRRRIVSNAGAKPGDVLYLTKSLGMGAMTTGAKQKKITWEMMLPAAQQMARTNAAAAAAMVTAGATACTDITGFGLVGHARNIALASGVTLQFEWQHLPMFRLALELVEGGTMSGASKRGRTALADVVTWKPRAPGSNPLDSGAGVPESVLDLVHDAETSGGLLIAIPAMRAKDLERELAARDVLVARVGECRPKSTALVELV